MKFSIITPTYKRPKELIRAVQSVLDQNYLDFEMIIVNDSPDFDYSEFENGEGIKDNRIRYFKNEKNTGVNFSRNFALESISKTSDYVVFLDDDDFLAKDSLRKVNDILTFSKNKKIPIAWLVTNFCIEEISQTKVRKIKKKYNYFWDILLFKNIKGDATHTISRKLAISSRFSTKIKNGEEWFYFIKLPATVIYKDINTKDSNGYLPQGLTDILKDKYKGNTKLLWKEKITLKIFLYLLLRQTKCLLS